MSSCRAKDTVQDEKAKHGSENGAVCSSLFKLSPQLTARGPLTRHANILKGTLCARLSVSLGDRCACAHRKPGQKVAFLKSFNIQVLKRFFCLFACFLASG